MVSNGDRYQIYDSFQAFFSSISGLIASRAALESIGVGSASSTLASAVMVCALLVSLTLDTYLSRRYWPCYYNSIYLSLQRADCVSPLDDVLMSGAAM